MKAFKIIALVVMICFSMIACKASLRRGGDTNKPGEAGDLGQYRIAGPSYPKMNPYPDEYAFSKANGDFDSEAFGKDYDAWKADKDKQEDFRQQFKGEYQNFYRKTAQLILGDQNQANQAYSPISLYMALAMLSETTGGTTKSQILDLLGSQPATIAGDAKALWNSNYSADTASNSLLANSLWLREDLAYQKKNIDRLADDYYASVFQGPMGSDAYNQVLQSWLNQQTGNLLQEQAKELTFSTDTVLGLVSTVYFQEKWSEGFMEEANSQETFYGDKEEVEAEFMHQSESGFYYWSHNFSAIHKSLLDGSAGMWFILPDEDTSIGEVLANEEFFTLTSRQPSLESWQNKKDVTINLSLPKFDVAANYDLTAPLKDLGVGDVFDPDKADFSPLLENQDIPLWLSQVKQGTRVAIDEEGVTAASFTQMSVMGAAMPPTEEVDFTLNRPFLFVVTGISGDPLFIGLVKEL